MFRPWCGPGTDRPEYGIVSVRLSFSNDQIALLRRTPVLLVAVMCLVACVDAPVPARADTHRADARTPVTSSSATATAAPSDAKADTNVAPDAIAVEDSLAPTMPRTFHDVCQGEDCERKFSAFACTALTLRADTLDASPVVAKVPAHDTVQVIHRVLHLVAPGIVRVRRTFPLDWDLDGFADRRRRRDVVNFSAGDTLYLLHYRDLGRWQWWYRGRVSSSAEFWDGTPDTLSVGNPVTDSSVAEVLSHPRHEEWWRVELSATRGGWWHAEKTGEQAISTRDMSYWGDACGTHR
jgi:hypothetical protein